jgi:hypothetical protein
MARSPIAVFLALSAVFACNAALTGTAAAGTGNKTVKASEVPSAAVATEHQPATVRVRGGSGGAALEVTARPVGGEDSSAPYLVGVFVGGGKPGGEPSRMLGSFSFYPVRAGEAQTFIIPKPQPGDSAPGKDVTLSIKLIPANAARDIKGAAVEILGARVVE